VPRLKCTYREFVAILDRYRFEMIRHDGGSHRRYRGVVGGTVRLVDVAYHAAGDEIPLGTLESMIRQSGLSKRLFRK
jgi:predicted RNA binding protein YcfA (HicA-like mRNA interferase family)